MPVTLDLEGFLKLFSDSGATQKWVKQVLEVTNAHNHAKREAERAVEESGRELAGHDKQRADHAAKLEADRAAFDKKCAAAWEEIQAGSADKGARFGWVGYARSSTGPVQLL
jgi:hypothetical protein